MERTFTLLNYALVVDDGGKGIEAILQNIKDKTLLKEILTAQQEVEFSDGKRGTLTPLGHAMLRNGGKKKIEVILNNIHDHDLLKEILTAKQIVNGEEYTLLQYADHYAPECVTIIEEKMKEAGLLDQHTSQPTFFDQNKGKAALVASIVFIATATAAALITPWLAIVSVIAASIAIGVLGTAIYSEYKSQEAPDKSVSEAVRSTFKEMAAEFIATKKQGIFVG